MPTLQELRDQRAAAWAQAQTYNERTDMTGEDEAAWARALDEVDTLGEQIRNRERQAELDTRFADIDANTRAVTPDGAERSFDEYRAAFNAWCRGGMAALNQEQRELIEGNFLSIGGDNQRALGSNVGSAGGYTVPEGFWAKVTETLKYFGGATTGAEVITTSTGNDLPWATTDDTSSEGYILGENVAATNEGDLTFGQKKLGAFTFVSGPALVSLILLNDSAVDIEALVARKMGERIGRRRNRAHTTGTGSSEPQGYMSALTVGKTTASATAITYDEIIDLVHSVDAAYRASGRCRFKMHDLVLANVRKLRDDSGGSGLGRPLWEPAIRNGEPDMFLGYPYDINNDQDSAITATKKTLAFGDFAAAYVVREVGGGQMMRLTERYAEYLQVGFIGYQRADGLVQDASAAKVLQQHS